MAARKAKKPKHQKSEYPTLPGQLGYLNSYYCPVCGKHLATQSATRNMHGSYRRQEPGGKKQGHGSGNEDT